MALRILHQSVNGNLGYVDFLLGLRRSLLAFGLDYEDLSLEAVLKHVLAPSSSSTLPRIVLFHVSETNNLLEGEQQKKWLDHLMYGAYSFNNSNGGG